MSFVNRIENYGRPDTDPHSKRVFYTEDDKDGIPNAVLAVKLKRKNTGSDENENGNR